jgi:hypothetical protein
MTGRILGGPNWVPWMLCAMLRRWAAANPDRSRDLIDQDALVSVFLGINTIEAFTNCFFRVVADEVGFAHARAQIIQDLANRRSLEKKLCVWPRIAFGCTIPKGGERWQNFLQLRDLRNKLTHFKAGHEGVQLPDRMTITGLVDLSLFAELNANTPICVLRCVKGIVEAIGECRGCSTQAFVHQWLGMIE